MKKIAILSVILAVSVNLMAYEKDTHAATDWLDNLSQSKFIEKNTEESQKQCETILESSSVSNTSEILDEAYLISLSAISGTEFTITPTYRIETSKYPSKKARTYIESIDKKFSLPGYNLVYRELLAHRVAETLADNAIVDCFKEESNKITLTGCRVFWEHHGDKFYLMDSDLDQKWEVAGHGDFPTNRIYGKNEFQLEGPENLNMQDVHKIF